MLPDLKGFFIALIVLAAIAGAIVAYVVPWLWGFVKPLLHAITG